MAVDAWVGPVIVAASIAATVTVLGWVVAGRRDRYAGERRRLERQNDISTALHAEIMHYRDALAFFDLDAQWESVVNQMEADESYFPFILSERNDTIFQAIVGDVHILPKPDIQPVTRYYNQVFAIEAIIADLRSESLRSEPQTKRIAAYKDYISLKKEALAAIMALDNHLNGTDHKLVAVRRLVSGARSGLTHDRGR
jgi:hypothetical protein